MARSSRHEGIVEAGGQPRGRDPIHCGEEFEVRLAFDVQVEVDATVLVQNKVSYRVRTLNF